MTVHTMNLGRRESHQQRAFNTFRWDPHPQPPLGPTPPTSALYIVLPHMHTQKFLIIIMCVFTHHASFLFRNIGCINLNGSDTYMPLVNLKDRQSQ